MIFAASEPQSWHSESDERLRFMLMLALIVHSVLVLALSFTFPTEKPSVESMEITLARFDDQDAPDEADFLAQANQQGSGPSDEKREPSVTERALFEAAELRAQSAQASSVLSEPAITQPPIPTENRNLREELVPEVESTSGSESLLTTTSEREQKATEKDQVEATQAPAPQAGTSTSLLARSLEIANLQARLRQEQEQLAKRPKVTRVTSASTLADQDATYHENWRRRIETIGNLNYPEEARARNIHGSLQLLVAIRPDGSIHQVDILRSSGYAVLDDAAIRIVQMAAPFQPFSPEMRERTDILEIIRTWKFEKEARIY